MSKLFNAQDLNQVVADFLASLSDHIAEGVAKGIAQAGRQKKYAPPMLETQPKGSQKICTHLGCNRPARARGLCTAHYQRVHYAEKHGAVLPTKEEQPPAVIVEEPPIVKFAKVRDPHTGEIIEKQLCATPGCTRPAKYEGRCWTHTDHEKVALKATKEKPQVAPAKEDLPKPSKVCSVPGCGGKIASRGMCNKHYQQQLRKEGAPSKICKVPGCGQSVRKQGLCRRHLLNKAATPTAKKAARTLCSVPECTKPARVHGMCKVHYQKKYRAEVRAKKRAQEDAETNMWKQRFASGEFDDVPPTDPVRKNPSLCSVEGCDRPKRTFGLCYKHRNEQKGTKAKDKEVAAGAVHCKAIGCAKPVHARGLCNSHYNKEVRAAAKQGVERIKQAAQPTPVVTASGTSSLVDVELSVAPVVPVQQKLPWAEREHEDNNVDALRKEFREELYVTPLAQETPYLVEQQEELEAARQEELAQVPKESFTEVPTLPPLPTEADPPVLESADDLIVTPELPIAASPIKQQEPAQEINGLFSRWFKRQG